MANTDSRNNMANTIGLKRSDIALTSPFGCSASFGSHVTCCLPKPVPDPDPEPPTCNVAGITEGQCLQGGCGTEDENKGKISLIGFRPNEPASDRCGFRVSPSSKAHCFGTRVSNKGFSAALLLSLRAMALATSTVPMVPAGSPQAVRVNKIYSLQTLLDCALSTHLALV